MALSEGLTVLVWVAALALVLFSFLALIKFTVQCFRIDRRLKLIPCSDGIFALGKAYELAKADYPWRLPRKWCDELSSALVRFKIMEKRVVYTNDPKVARVVLLSHADHFRRDLSLTTSPYGGYLSFLGKGILVKESVEIRSRIVNGLKIDALPQKTLQAIHRVVGLLRTAEIFEAPVDLADTFNQMSLQLATELVLGVNHTECDELFSNTYLPLVAECERRVWKPWRQFQPWLQESRKFANSLKNLETTLLSLTRVRWALLRAEAKDPAQTGSTNTREGDILDSLLGAFPVGLPLNREQELRVVDELKGVLFSYHEPLSSVLSWAFFEIISDPDLALHLSREWENEFGTLAPGESPSLDRLRRLRWAPAILRETLRKYPPMPIVSRTVKASFSLKREDSGLAQDILIPRNVHFFVGIEGIHHRRDLWPNPEKFLPQRFLDFDQEIDQGTIDPSSFIPFLSGSRACPGSDAAFLHLSMIISYVSTAMTDGVPLKAACGTEEKLVFEFASDPLKLATQMEQHFPLYPKYGLPIKPLPKSSGSETNR